MAGKATPDPDAARIDAKSRNLSPCAEKVNIL